MPKILLVEDSEENRQLMCWMLEDAGYEVDEANDAETGIQKLEQDAAAYTLILMDIGLPGMQGDAAIQTIRKLNIDTPIVALTGYVDQSDQEHFMSCGANLVVAKPVEEDAFLESIKVFK